MEVIPIIASRSINRRYVGSSKNWQNSSTQNKPWQYEENKTRKPIFEIGFDTITKKYKVYNQTNQRLSNDKLEEVAFTIEIKNKDGSEKKTSRWIGKKC